VKERNGDPEGYLKKFFRIPRIDYEKPPLEPKWSIIMSLSVLIGGLVIVCLANFYFYVPLVTALLWYGVVVYITFGFSWSLLEWRTRNAAIRGHNAFVVFTVCLLGVLIIVQEDYEAFPTWGVVLLIVAGIAGYSVGVICGVRNLVKWLRGEYSNKQPPPLQCNDYYGDGVDQDSPEADVSDSGN